MAVVSLLKAAAHGACLMALLWLCGQFGMHVDINAFTIALGVAALQRTYARHLPTSATDALEDK